MRHIFIFPNSVRSDDRIKLNIHGDELELWCNDKKVTVREHLLRSGSSTSVIRNYMKDEFYPLYNFREILQYISMAPAETLRLLGINGYMQIDRSGGDSFIKVFLPVGQEDLLSDTTDFSGYPHVPGVRLHELDRAYSWNAVTERARLEGGRLFLQVFLHRSTFCKDPLYVSHGGQSMALQDGENEIVLEYVPMEDVYYGLTENGRYVGRRANIKEIIQKQQTGGHHE